MSTGQATSMLERSSCPWPDGAGRWLVIVLLGGICALGRSERARPWAVLPERSVFVLPAGPVASCAGSRAVARPPG